MKIWHISDTHGIHHKLSIPKNIDIVVHTGDCSNNPNPRKNEFEVRDFITWFDRLPIKHKVFVPGNHDTSIEYAYVHETDFSNLGIHLLVDKSVVLEGLTIYGTPWCPQWGAWSYMYPRKTLYENVFKNIPEGIDILLSHTPPMGQLDLTWHAPPQGGPHIGWENVGCEDLAKRVLEVNPKLHCFGHIHSFKDGNGRTINNNGVFTPTNWPSVVSNAATNLHGSFGDVWCPGNVIDWNFVQHSRGEYDRQ